MVYNLPPNSMTSFSVLNWNQLAMEAHAGNIIKRRLTSFAFEKTPRISLTCRLVPVQYREYEYGLFPPLDVPAGNHGSCIHHLGLDICFDHS